MDRKGEASLIDIDRLDFVGRDLMRPECVLATADGSLHLSDWRGGVTVISPDGVQRSILAQGDFTPKPNGIGLLADGSWLLAHLGDEDGGLYRLQRDGTLSAYLLTVDGEALPPTNYVHVDGRARIWITVSTRLSPRSLGYRGDIADGYIVLVDDAGARIVADGLGYTNECLVHPTSGQLYVNETFARRLSRFDVGEDGRLSNKTTIAEFGAGTFPDGLTFDAEGGIWITSIVSNRVIRVQPDGRQQVLLEDSDAAHLDWVEEAYLSGTMDRPHLDRAAGRRLKNISSLAFGGGDLRTVYLGCLLGDAIASFRSDVAGLPPYHWNNRSFVETLQA